MNQTTPFHSRQWYADQIAPLLAAEVFQPRPGRLLWLPVHAGIIFMSWYAGYRFASWPLKLFGGLVIGHSLGTLGFLAHEIMHGSVVRHPLATRILGGLGMLHWGIAPSLWMARHNGLHHGYTNHPSRDPDCFGDEALYRKSRIMRRLVDFTPGSGTLRSWLFLFIWFSFHFGFIAFRFSPLSRRSARNYARFHYVAAHLAWLILTLWVPGGWAWLFLVPIASSNFTMMAYATTNHWMNPLTPDCNDPLLNSLTVRSHPWLECIHLQNNFHVEHHIFPNVNPCFTPYIAKLIQAKWPELYQSESHAKALVQEYRTPKVYRTSTCLVNPRTNQQVPTRLAELLEK